MTEDEFDKRLTAADPAEGMRASRQALDEAFAASTVRAPINRRRKLGVVAGVASLVLIGSAITLPAAADAIREFLAQTGEFGGLAGDSESDSSEWIDVTQSDASDYALSVFPPGLRLPKGVDSQEFAARVVVDLGLGSAGSGEDEGVRVVQETGIKSEFERRALCLWIGEVLDSEQRGAVDAEAIDMLGAAHWPNMSETFVGIEDFLAEAQASVVGGSSELLTEGAIGHLCTDAERTW